METTNTRVQALFSDLRKACRETADVIAMRAVAEREDSINEQDTSCFVRQSILSARRKAESILDEINSIIEEARAAHKANILAEDPEIMSELSPEESEEIWRAILDCYEEDLWKSFPAICAPTTAPSTAPSIPDLDIESMIAGERSWLQDTAREYAGYKFCLHCMVAAGLVIRHSSVVLTDDNGISAPNAIRAREWAKTITPDQAESVRSTISHEANILREKIMDLDFDDELSMLDIQQDRDDLESVLRVLDAAGYGDLAAEDIESIDLLAAQKGLVIAPQSERYSEASVADPDAWWAFNV